jgi:hypothetical protein
MEICSASLFLCLSQRPPRVTKGLEIDADTDGVTWDGWAFSFGFSIGKRPRWRYTLLLRFFLLLWTMQPLKVAKVRVGGGYKRFLELMIKDTLGNARLVEVEACFAFAFAFAFMLTGWTRDVAQGRMIVQIANRTLISPLHHEILMYHRLVIVRSIVRASCIQSHCRHRRCL